jgi:hypothetical protein
VRGGTGVQVVGLLDYRQKVAEAQEMSLDKMRKRLSNRVFRSVDDFAADLDRIVHAAKL